MPKNNWTKAVNEVNRELYTIPEGWETREQVAASLQCAPDRVSDLLKPGLAAGKFEARQFSIWEEKRRMAVKVTCYRVVQEGEEVPSAGRRGPKSSNLEGRILAAIKAAPTVSNGAIAKKIYKARAADVARVRATLKK